MDNHRLSTRPLVSIAVDTDECGSGELVYPGYRRVEATVGQMECGAAPEGAATVSLQTETLSLTPGGNN